jgi:hypothetical protein
LFFQVGEGDISRTFGGVACCPMRYMSVNTANSRLKALSESELSEIARMSLAEAKLPEINR